LIVTSNRTVNTYRQDRALRYGADGALELAVVKAQTNHSLGDTADAEVCATLPLDGDLSDPVLSGMPDARGLFESGSALVVQCYQTPGSLSGSEYRDITFEVLCGLSGGGSGKLLRCDPAAPDEDRSVVGTARIRYDNDPGYTPAGEQARVPKVISWELRR